MKVLVVGAGGLSHPLCLALVRESDVALTVADGDRVEVSNLHRQILFREADVGDLKVDALCRELRLRAPNAELCTHDASIGLRDVDWVSRFDFVFDTTDGHQTKLAINDLCVDAEVPFAMGGVLGTTGQAMAAVPGQTACLRCVFEDGPLPEEAPTCKDLGTLGPVAGIVASKQLREAKRILGGDVAPLGLAEAWSRFQNRVRTVNAELWTAELRTLRERTLHVRRRIDCGGCGAEKVREQVQTVDPSLVDDPAEVLDLTARVCPDTFVLAGQALERLAPGQRLWVWLASDESARQVPRGIRGAGHEVLARLFDGRTHRLLLERRGGTS